jgi:glycerol transport system permease protein
MKRKYGWLVLALYLAFTLAPIYWMVHMSLRSNLAITSTFAWLPESLSFANYATIFTDAAWYGGYVNSIIYVVLNSPRRTLFRAIRSSATSTCSSGC